MRFSFIILSVLFSYGNSLAFDKTLRRPGLGSIFGGNLPPLPPGISNIVEKNATPKSNLNELVLAQSDQRVSVALDIGKPGITSRLAVKGMVFDLKTNFNNDFVKMPGLNGPIPSLSGGLNALTTVQDGSFISMAGSETVKTSKGCWEIIWRDGAPSGSLLYGFEIDQDYKRNDATLPKGTIYVAFNTWTSEGLKEAQDYKDRTVKKANNSMNKRRESLAKMRESTNFFDKARHYYNALAAAETHTRQPSKMMSLVPSTDEVIHLEGGMQVSPMGQVWTQDLPGKPIKLGSARMQAVSKEV